jgi:glycosyltransferase involved in cell wall biosynthesis
MKECSIYVNLSRLDPFGVGVIEAMAVGLIPIVSENVGAKVIIEKVDKTLIVNSEEKAVIKILELFSNRIKLAKLSQKLKKKAIEECNKEKSIKKFKKALYSFI